MTRCGAPVRVTLRYVQARVLKNDHRMWRGQLQVGSDTLPSLFRFSRQFTAHDSRALCERTKLRKSDVA